MGVFIWHQWAQVVRIFASVCTIWGGLWGIFFRKFFWDFVNGTLMPGPNNAINGRKCFDDNPCGIVPAKQDAIFISLIVKAPVIQLFAILFGVTHLVIELLPVIRRMSIYRSFALRIVTYSLQTFLSVLIYQGTNGAIYSFVAVIGFTVAQMKGEIVEEAREQRGRGDKA
jgi:vacuolar-type H+-ATPase subunit I/STV1